MRTISCKQITEEIKKIILKIGVCLDSDCLKIMEENVKYESGAARFALDITINNAYIAKENDDPVCQDTGMAVIFIKAGQEVHFIDGNIEDALNEGVREAYSEGFFRKSVLDPITRQNTGDNTPAVIHYSIVPGDKVNIDVTLKGFGSENMSRLFMLPPSAGLEGIKESVIKSVAEAGGNPCPPVVVGVGIGGTMEKAALMSKHALTRSVKSNNSDAYLDELEKELTDRINALGIGPQGFGGKLTCLRVLIEKYPTHLAGLPVAVTMQCHAVRHGSIEL